MNGIINTAIVDDFTVLDLSGVRKAGITLTDFTKKLYNPSGTEVSGTVAVTITELELGNYRASFTPNVIGIWKLVVTHATYFPQGKENDYKIYNEDFDSLDFTIDAGFLAGAKESTVTGLNDITAEDVWAVGTKALTDKAGFSISGTIQTLDGLNNISAIQVNSEVADALSDYNTTGVAKEASVLSIQNNTSFVASIPAYFLIPASSYNVYKLRVCLYDDAGSMEDPDDSDFGLSVSTQNAVDKNATLFKEFACSTPLGNSGISTYKKLEKEATGIYFCFIKIASTETVIQIMYDFAILESTVQRNFTRTNMVYETEPGTAELADTTTNADIIAKAMKSRDVSLTSPVTGSIYEGIDTNFIDIKGTGFTKDEDSLVDLSHGNIEVTAQIVRDAMKLAPTSGTPSAGSIDEKLNLIPTNPMLDTTVIETGYTVIQTLKLILSILVGKTTITDLGGGLATVKFRDINDAKDRVTASMTGSERTNITVDKI